MEPRNGMDADGEDFVLEVSDLRTGQILDRHLASSPAAHITAPAGRDLTWDDADDEFTVTSLESDAPTFPRRPPRLPTSARARGLVATSIALVICLAVLLKLTGIRQGLGEALNPATPAPVIAIEPGDSVIYFVQSVPWGTLTVDGNAVTLLGDDTSVTLDRGTHAVRFVAAPFATLRCQISVPADVRHDTCPLASSNPTLTGLSTVRAVNLGASPNDLPADAYDSLVGTVSATFAASPQTAIVARGDHYLGVDGAAVASMPLIASLTLDLNVDPSRPFPDLPPNPSCISFCNVYGQVDPTAWTIQAHVVAEWHFSTPDGAYVPSTSTVIDSSLTLKVRWINNVWSLVALSPPTEFGPICGDAIFFPAGGVPPIMLTGSSFANSALAPNPVDGCIEIFSASDDVHPPAVGIPADAAVYMYRFGVVLAGNALAHQQQPQLPLATDHERVLALRWFQASS